MKTRTAAVHPAMQFTIGAGVPAPKRCTLELRRRLKTLCDRLDDDVFTQYIDDDREQALRSLISSNRGLSYDVIEQSFIVILEEIEDSLYADRERYIDILHDNIVDLLMS